MNKIKNWIANIIAIIINRLLKVFKIELIDKCKECNTELYHSLDEKDICYKCSIKE